MKRHLGRELLWLSLPVVLVGGMAFYKTRGGRFPASQLLSSLDNGPRRVEFSPPSTVELSPMDVYSGYDWGVEATIWKTGKLNVPSSWKEQKFAGDRHQFKVVYRVGTEWKTIVNSEIGLWLGSDEVTIKTKLRKVPRDAKEVRLQGEFQFDEIYRGVMPAGWRSPSNVKHAGLNHFFLIRSEPIDIPIIEKGDAWPSPQVSHQQQVQIIEGKWLRDSCGEHLMLRARANANSGLKGEFDFSVQDVKYFDADGKPLFIYQDATSTVPAFVQGLMRGYTNYKMPDDENILRLMQYDAQSRGGWSKVKMPITITGMASSGGGWPTPFKVRVSPQQGVARDYGAPPKTKPALAWR